MVLDNLHVSRLATHCHEIYLLERQFGGQAARFNITKHRSWDDNMQYFQHASSLSPYQVKWSEIHPQWLIVLSHVLFLRHNCWPIVKGSHLSAFSTVRTCWLNVPWYTPRKMIWCPHGVFIYPGTLKKTMKARSFSEMKMHLEAST